MAEFLIVLKNKLKFSSNALIISLLSFFWVNDKNQIVFLNDKSCIDFNYN